MSERFLHFEASVGNRLLPMAAVVEVIPMVRLDKTEGEGNGLYRGLLAFRGRTLPVFDLNPATEEVERSEWFLVVARSASQEFALVAREIHDLIEVAEDDLAQLQTGGERPVSVASVGGELVRIVDSETFFT